MAKSLKAERLEAAKKVAATAIKRLNPENLTSLEDFEKKLGWCLDDAKRIRNPLRPGTSL